MNPVIDWFIAILDEYGTLFEEFLIEEGMSVVPIPVFEDNGFYWRKFDTRWHIAKLLRANYDEYFELRPAEEAVEFLLDVEEVELPTSSPYIPYEEASEGYKKGILSQALKMLRYYLEEGGDPTDPDLDALESIYSGHIEYWQQDSIEAQCYMPLVALDSNIDSVELDDQLRLERFTTSEKNDLHDALVSGMAGDHYLSMISGATHRFVAEYVGGKSSCDPPKNLRAKIKAAIAALRLFREGEVTTVGIVRAYPEVVDSARMGAGRTSSREFCQGAKRRAMPGGPAYASNPLPIDSKEIEAYRDIYRLVIPIYLDEGPFHHLRMPLRRFHYTYSRDTDVDKILDLAVCLEATVLADIRQELSFRLALRGAALLAERRDPKNTYAILRALYDARSQIVHAGKRLSEIANRNGEIMGIPRKELVTNVRQVTREILVEYLRRLDAGESMRDIGAAQEEQLIDSVGGDFEWT